MTSRTLFTLTLLAAVLGAIAQPALAQTKPPAAQLQAAASEIGFTTRQMGVPVDGKFGKFTAQVSLDPRQPATGSVAFTIDTTSARFGSAEIDAEIPKAIWLDSKRFPQASFQSSSIKAAGPGRFEVAGKLTIKGQTREVMVPVTVTQAAGTSTASGQFVIKRLDFKVGEAEWTDTSLLANEVTVRFKLALTGIAPL
jgi:polyisoprenoid-binding protein YceI